MKKRIWVPILLVLAIALSISACASTSSPPTPTPTGQIIFTDEFSVEVEGPIKVEVIQTPPQKVYVGNPVIGIYRIVNHDYTPYEMTYCLEVEGLETSKTEVNATFTHCEGDNCWTSYITTATVQYWYLEVDPDGPGPKIPWPYTSGKPILLEGYGEHLLYLTVVPPPEQGARTIKIKVEIKTLGTPETPKG